MIRMFLIVLLFIVYFKVLSFIWNVTGIGELGDIIVLIGSGGVLLVSGIGAVLTVNHLIYVLNRQRR